ncbi:hypothetical protein CPLU01_09834 [Colletotrichum plurivorum]|uniref:DUF7587 domain-containing protein n=1 Tax=Colletotrichum plurivorum TaxID=2175906 RepID=A0A8H6K7A4_9PEZI|nr:hypothetical protein CPLU01_09834 [Colletotrichum plurivorum]
MSPVPAQDVMVAKFAPDTTRIEDNTSEVLGWLAKSTLDKRVPRGLCLGPESTEKVEAVFPGVLKPMNSARDVGFVRGTALLSTDCKVSTVSDEARPETLFRVIHAGHPNKGIISRLGRRSDPISFQLQLRKHLRHQCREPSPFLSATSNWSKARKIAQRYARKGHGGVKIIWFRTDGPHWNHNVQRLWYPRDVLRQLGLGCDGKSYLEDEYLVEHSIPEESITRCIRLGQDLCDGPIEKLFGVVDQGGLKMTRLDIRQEQKREAAEEAKKRQAREKAEKKKEEKREKEELKRKRSDNDGDELCTPGDQPDGVEAASQSQVETVRRGSKRNKVGKPQRPGDMA